jgi:phage tail sheath protein FI
MPVTPSYPGIYIEELPNSAHTITAAPTSIAVFVGYTHPFKTQTFGKAIEIFNFTDYERWFGGLYVNDRLDNNVAYAVQQFFLNGGSIAWVVGLQPSFWDGTGANQGAFTAATATIATANIVFTAREPTDSQRTMRVLIGNVKPSAKQPATAQMGDIQVSYGTQVETFRGVDLGITDTADPGFVENRINKASSLVQIAPSGSYGLTFPAPAVPPVPVALTVSPAPNPAFTTFSPSDFAPVFQQDSSLDKLDIFNLLILPGVADAGIWSQALAFCEKKRAFFIMDPPPGRSADGVGNLPLVQDDVDVIPKSANGALYFPYLLSPDPLTGNQVRLPPSGFVAGIYARTDNNRGVWKAPAGLETTVLNTAGVVEEGRMTDLRQGVLNPKGVNCLRTFAGVGTVVFGARTLVTQNPAFQQWRYVPVRRMALFIEQTLFANLGWVVFEPNDEPLWLAIRTSIDGFMLSLFRQGAFQGDKPSQAFQVKCDSSTTTQTDIDNGIVNIIVAFRPLKPAEFVIIKIAQLAGQVQS